MISPALLLPLVSPSVAAVPPTEPASTQFYVQTAQAQFPPPMIVTIGQPEKGSPEDEQFNDEDEPSHEGMVVIGTQRDSVDEFSLDTFQAAQDLDKAFVEPVADFYRDVVPSPLRSASRNFARNLGEPVNALNYLLQLKPGKAIETAGRFLINSTLGIGGLIDVAGSEGLDLPYRYNGFANTLGYYGVKPGRYLYLPLIGSTTPRDLVGNTLDRLLIPVIYGPPVDDPVFGISLGVVSSLNQRIENDEMIQRLREESADPFGDARNTYLRLREQQIEELRGKKDAEPETKTDNSDAESADKDDSVNSP